MALDLGPHITQCVTCCLECCREHKTRSGCTGKRDRTGFCSFKGFSDTQLASDYHFLEDVLKVSEGSKRLYHGICGNSSFKSSTASNKRSKKSYQPGGRVDLGNIAGPADHPLLQATNHRNGSVRVLVNDVKSLEHDDAEMSATDQSNQSSKIPSIGLLSMSSPESSRPRPSKGKVDPLKRQAEAQEVNLLRMPPGMERRKLNTSRYSKKSDSITWKVELMFHSADGHVLKLESEMVESASLSGELSKHLDVHQNNRSFRSQLKEFVSAPRESLLLFMKRLPCSSSSPMYFKLDPSVPLESVLRGKTIIEYPVVEVVLEADKDKYPLFIGEL
ncbi:hypothetical protein THAOC_02695 [Thalassiosira oceanica]|uniref:BCD1 alpha/beta domain-containing protein n=1 Tax=Thalassiosira oceanica TaxID=159749 RepID=K0TA27_THAOC|nr:hypothetical protein THAOC_02695 [Thalassiosira oceanica]|eukprot:EJK75578.1 hypothetical protein THAOC_02695 [Thalassiosira oceanica]